MVRDADGREPEAAEGTPGAQGPEAPGPAPLHAHAGGHPHHVPVLRESRQRRRRRPRRRSSQEPVFDGSQGSLLQPLQQSARCLLTSKAAAVAAVSHLLGFRSKGRSIDGSGTTLDAFSDKGWCLVKAD